MNRIHTPAISKIETAQELYTFLMKNDPTNIKVVFRYAEDNLFLDPCHDDVTRQGKKGGMKGVINCDDLDFDSDEPMGFISEASMTADELAKYIDASLEEDDKILISCAEISDTGRFTINFDESRLVHESALDGSDEYTIFIFALDLV